MLVRTIKILTAELIKQSLTLAIIRLSSDENDVKKEQITTGLHPGI